MIAPNRPDVPDPAGLCIATAKRYAEHLRAGEDLFDLVGAAYLRYHAARETYLPDTGVSFVTHAHRACAWGARDFLRERHRNGIGSLSRGAPIPETVNIDALRSHADPLAERRLMQQVENNVDRERVLRHAHSISSRAREVMRHRLDGLSSPDVGRLVGISHTRVLQIEREVKEKIASLDAAYAAKGTGKQQDYGRDRLSDAETCRWCGLPVAWVRPDAVWHKVDAEALSDPCTFRTKTTRYPHKCAPVLRALEEYRVK